MNTESEDIKLCDDCLKLVGKTRGTPPHAKLVKTAYKPFSSPMGQANETYYKCTVCGQEWLYETGTCGYGWIK